MATTIRPEDGGDMAVKMMMMATSSFTTTPTTTTATTSGSIIRRGLAPSTEKLADVVASPSYLAPATDALDPLHVKRDDFSDTVFDNVDLVTPSSSVSKINLHDEENYRRNLTSLYKSLRQEALFNVEIYKKDFHELSPTDQQLYAIFCELYDHLDNIDGVLLDILDLSPAYDFKNYKINGYRSLVNVTQSCLAQLAALVRYISVNKKSYLFRSSHYIKELESYVMVLGQLRDVLRYARKLMNYSPKGQLWPSEKLLDTAVADEIQMEMDMIDQECFYGRALGFQVLHVHFIANTFTENLTDHEAVAQHDLLSFSELVTVLLSTLPIPSLKTK